MTRTLQRLTALAFAAMSVAAVPLIVLAVLPVCGG